MWTFEHTEQTTATPDQLWRRYADTATWPEWDSGTDRVVLDGPFAAGTKGHLKPVGGPKTKFELLETNEAVSFTDVSFLPLAKMHFAHKITPGETTTAFTHRVTISGPLAPLFARVIGKKIAAELPGAMRKLAQLAADS